MTDEATRPAGVAFWPRHREPEPTLARHLGIVAAVFDAAPIGVGVWSVDGELLYANPVLCGLVDQALDELVGQRFEYFIEPAQAPDVRQFVEDLWSGERNYFECDFRCVQIDGTDHWLRTRLTAVYGPETRPAYLLSQIFDFTSSRVTVSAPDVLAQDAPVMLWLTDDRGIPRVANRRTYEFLGESPLSGELHGGLVERAHPDDHAALLAALREGLRARTPIDFVARSRRADGEWRWLQHRAEPVTAADGTFVGYVGASSDVTAYEQTRLDLERTVHLFRAISEASPYAVAKVDRRGRVVFTNERWDEMIPASGPGGSGDDWQRLLHPDEARDIVEHARQSVITGEPFTYRVTAAGPDVLTLDPSAAPNDVRYWAELRVVPVFDEHDRHDGWVATLADVSAEIAADSRADRLARVLDAGSDFLMITERNGAITYVNNAAQDVLGVAAVDDRTPDATPDFLTDVLDSDSFELFNEQVEPVLIEEGVWRGELVLRGRDGDDIPVSALLLAQRNAAGGIESISAVARDISDLKVAQSQLHELATHDYLTGMPNRVLLYDRLEQALARFHRYGQPVALLFLDLDRFKPINDQYGHQVGDRVLRTVAERINGVIRETDTGARVGGDEFCILVEGIGDLSQLEAIAARLIEVVDEPIAVDGEVAGLGASIGLVAVDDSCADADALMALADAAMYQAKAAGRGRWVVYRSGDG